MRTKFSLNETLQEELISFIDIHDIGLLSQGLRRQFINYLDYELRTAVPLYFDTFIYPFNELLDLLDKIAAAYQEFSIGEKMNKQALKHATLQERAVAFLTASLSPEKLFLVHHEIKKDKQECFDILAVIPEASQTNFTAYQQVISMANIEGAALQVSLHKAATLYKQLEEGHIYYSVICNEANLIYDTSLTHLPRPKKDVINALAEKANNEFDTAHKKADSFLNGASIYRGENEKEMAAFMLQQAVELTLRGLITALLGTCPKTHCFKELRKPLKRCAPELSYIISANEEEEIRLLTVLEKAYLEARYSNQFVISDKEIDVLTEGAEELHEKTMEVFKEKIRKIGTA